jgi:hypothetical protein
MFFRAVFEGALSVDQNTGASRVGHTFQATPSKSTCPSMLEMLTEGSIKSTTPPVTGSGYKLVNTVDQLKR